MSSSKCTCTPGYTCRGLCFSNDALHNFENRKRAYTTKWAPIGRQASKHQKFNLHIPAIAIGIAKLAYLKKKRCCSGSCILTIVEKCTLNKVVSAVHLARSNAYHTNANHAHGELREMSIYCRSFHVL